MTFVLLLYEWYEPTTKSVILWFAITESGSPGRHMLKLLTGFVEDGAGEAACVVSSRVLK